MIKITTVETKKDLSDFVEFPWQIYKDDKVWVPPLKSEVRDILDEKKNPFWEHAVRKLFLVRSSSINDGKGDKILARAAAIVDSRYNEFHNEKIGFFGFFESVNDPSVARAILGEVEKWLVRSGMKKVMGPTAPSTNDEMGFLTEGFDTPPYIMMPHNPPYYSDLMESAGYKPVKNLLAYLMTEENSPKERIARLVEVVKKKEPFLVVRPLDLKNYKEEIKKIWMVYNNAWEKNWGFVPWTEKEFSAQCLRLKSLVLPDCVFIAEIKGCPVGILVGVPNYSEVLKRLNGRLGPIEVAKFLYYKNKIKTMRVMIMGVAKEYRNRGIEAVMFQGIIKNAPKHGIYTAEMSWILEDNIMMRRAAEMLGGYIHKKYTVFGKDLADK